MNTLFNTILANTSADLTFSCALISMALSLAFGFAISLTYCKTCGSPAFQRGMAITLVMLPVVLTMIILFVGSNVARAFSLAGTLAIVRFRSAPGNPKDIGFVFFSIGAGLACGVGLFAYGALFVATLCLVMIVIEKLGYATPKNIQKTLKITIPEDLNYQGAFDDILDKYTISHTLTRIKTTDLGSLFELVYSVCTPQGQDEQELLNQLRCRNGNLSIILTVAPTME